jgi:hypothetical protein
MSNLIPGGRDWCSGDSHTVANRVRFAGLGTTLRAMPVTKKTKCGKSSQRVANTAGIAR